MPTSELGPAPVAARSGIESGSTTELPGLSSSNGAPGAEHAISLGRALERLANEYFAGVPGSPLDPKAGSDGATPFRGGVPTPGATPFPGGMPAPAPIAPPSGLLPNALSVGAGGFSPNSGWVPPTPGFMQQPPPASGPPPKESDLRTLPAMLSEGFGISTPVALARDHEPDLGGALYFLEIAGLPKAPGGAAPPAPSMPSAAGGMAPRHAAAPAPSGGLGPAQPRLPPTAGLPASPAPNTAQPRVPGPAHIPGSGDWLSSHGEGYRVDELSLGSRASAAPATARLDRGARRQFDPISVKRDFPILEERVHNKRLVWLDNAATTQKPRAVIERVSHFYEHENSNIHRAAHTLAARSTDAYEGAREITRRFLNAPSVNEVIFTRGTTEAINLVAQSWGRRYLQSGDEVVITWLEHHANIVPWQQVCSERGARLRVAPVDEQGQVLMCEYEKLLGPRTKLVSLSHVSNALGTIVPVAEMVAMAHRYGAKVLVDGAQAVSHLRVDVQAIDCDFYVFSGHKIFGPTGIGALFGKADVLDGMPPWQGGGNMIRDVTFEKTAFQAAPARFEAGTPNIADAVGLGAALEYVSSLGLENISRHEHELLVYGTERLLRIPGLRMFGTAPDKAGVLSFTVADLKTEELGAALDREGIAVRAGHHCAQPILRRFGVEATVRASLAPYNTCEDLDALVDALQRLRAVRY